MPLRRLYYVDFTALPSQNLKANGDTTYTIDGRTWYSASTAQASVCDILNGTGMRIIRNGSTTFPPRVEAALLNLAPDARPFRGPLIFWTRVIYNSSAVAATWAHSHPFNNGLGSISTAYGRVNNAGTQQYRVTNDGTGFAFLTLNTTTNLTDDVHVCIMDDQYQTQTYSTVWSGGFPSWTSIASRGNALNTSSAFSSLFYNPGSGTGGVGFGVAADDITGGSAACSLTLTHLLIEGY